MSRPEWCDFISANKLRMLTDLKSLAEVKVMQAPNASHTRPTLTGLNASQHQDTPVTFFENKLPRLKTMD